MSNFRFRLFAIAAVVMTMTTALSIPSIAGADAASVVPGITITKTNDGTATFDPTDDPGSDSSATNGIVRTNDTVTFSINYSFSDPLAAAPTPYSNFRFQLAELPLGFVYAQLPPVCLTSGVSPVSSITGDGITTPQSLVCNLGTQSTGFNGAVSVTVRALPTAPHGTSFDLTGTVMMSGTSNTATDTEPGAVVSSGGLELDLRKANAGYYQTTVGGVRGYGVQYYMYTFLPKGSEVPVLPLTWTEDFSSVSPNAQLIDCLNWVAGTVTCTPGASQTVNVSVTNVPLLNNGLTGAPWQTSLGRYYSANLIRIFIPFDDIPENGSLSTMNKYSELLATGISGADNYGTGSEPGVGVDDNYTAGTVDPSDNATQNWQSDVFTKPGFNWDKYDWWYADQLDASLGFTSNIFNGVYPNDILGNCAVSIGTSCRGGDGYLAPGGTYSAMMFMDTPAINDIAPGTTMCMTLDADNVDLVPIDAGAPTRGAYLTTPRNPAGAVPAGWVVEYGTGGLAGAGTTWASHTDQKNGTCDDADSPTWWSDLTAIPAGTKITKIRARTTAVWTAANQASLLSGSTDARVYFLARLKLKTTAASLDIIPNWGKFKVNQTTPGLWRQPTYNENSLGGSGGDRILVAPVHVDIDKTTQAASATRIVGQEATFTLQPVVSDMGLETAPTATNVVIVDTLPLGLSYVPGSASPATPYGEPTVTVNAAGRQELRWLLGDRVGGVALPMMTFRALVTGEVTNGATVTNNVVISADNDPSPVATRSDASTLQVFNPSAFAVSKYAINTVVEPGEPIEYELRWVNLATPVTGTDFIDWLPFVGDGRTPATSHDGTYTLTSVSQTGGTQANTFKYTKFPSTSVSVPSDYDPTTINPAIQWCLATEFGVVTGCPASLAEVTGVRFEGGSITMSSGSTRVRMMITPGTGINTDKEDNIFTNRFRGRIVGNALPVESNNVTATVVLGSIGDYVWSDANRNGIQDAGELPLANVTVNLLDGAGAVLKTTTTNSTGHYLFDELIHGDYKIQVIPPVNYTITYPNLGVSDTADSDVAFDGITGLVSLIRGQDRTDVDAGLVSEKTAVSIVKSIANDDANTAPGVGVAPGSAMQVTFLVTNTGDVTLNGVTVTDSVIDSALITCPKTTLVAGESMTCTASIAAPAIAEQHRNVGSVVGSPIQNPDGTGLDDVTDTDVAYAYSKAQPAVVITKYINDNDANLAPGVQVGANTTMAVRFHVLNAGNVTLDPVVVTDDKIAAAAISCPRTFLEAGEAMDCTATYPAPVAGGQHTNTATVTATPVPTPGAPAPAPISDKDPANAWVARPAITIVKSIDGDDANKEPGVGVAYPSMMAVTFEVSNTGNVTLDPVVVTDDTIPASSIACPNTVLMPGASMTCVANIPAPAPGVQHSNVATAEGVPPALPDGTPVPPVTAVDNAFAFSKISPAISVIKRIDGFDANSAPGTSVNAGATMDITFQVTNTGNTFLSPVTLTDSTVAAGDITCPATFLASGDSMICSATLTAPAAGVQHTNTATATGTPADPDSGDRLIDLSTGTPVGDVGAKDPANALPIAGAISLVKRINGEDANTPPGVSVTPGDPMSVTFDVTNTGTAVLTEISIDDNVIAAADISCPQTTLKPDESMTCTATYPAPAGGVVHRNDAVVSGQPIHPDGAPAGDVVTAGDIAHAYGVSTGITMIKKINGQDANSAPGVSVNPGALMEVTFEVTNTGNVTLSPVTVTDDTIDSTLIACPRTQLVAGESMTCVATIATPAAGTTHTNTAVAEGTPVSNTGGPIIDPSTGKPFGPIGVKDPANATSTSPAISVIKRINGDDADKVPGVAVNGPDMTVTFEVTNIGDVRLDPVVIADDVIPAANIACPKSALDPGESMTCSAIWPAPAAGTIHTNNAYASGQPIGIDGEPYGSVVNDQNPANAYLAVKPAISIVKKINGQDANTDPGVMVLPGTTLNITFEVTNTGTVSLNPVEVSDSHVPTGAISCPKSTLAPAETMVCTASLPAPSAGKLHTNTATAVGTPVDADGAPLVDPTTGEPLGSVKDDDPANATALSPGLSILKLIEGDDADKDPGVAVADGMMEVSFIVTNTGDVTLNPVVVGDTVIPASQIACPKSVLLAGEQMTCRAEWPSPEPGQVHHNEATVVGQPIGTDGEPVGPTIESSNPAYAHLALKPAVEIVKYINGRDANEAPGVYVREGTLLEVTFEVTNTGNTPLSPVSVTDDVIASSDISCPELILLPGESMTCTASIDAPAAGELHTNEATVVGVPSTENGDKLVDPMTGEVLPTVTDSDTANATTADSGIEIVKKINGVDANTPPGVLVAAGSTMNISFEVTNTGTTDLVDVVVTDDVIAANDISCPQTVLAVGETMICDASYPAPAAGGEHRNVGSVVAQPVDGDGEPFGDTVTTSDPAHALAIDPKITVVKKINGVDANTVPGVSVAAGTIMEITFEVANEGNVMLSPVVLTDDVIASGDISCPRDTLEAGQTMICTATLPAPAPGALHSNTASVSGSPVYPDGKPMIDPLTGEPYAPVTDSDPANATSTAPGISVIKKINADDANAAPGVGVDVGSSMLVTFEVTNTGNRNLVDVTVGDNVIPAASIACPSTVLAVGASMLCSASWPAPSPGALHVNTAGVSGQPVNAAGEAQGLPVTDSDVANAYPTVAPAVSVVKRINGADANTAPGVSVQAGSAMAVTFDVSNDGDTWLSGIVVTDDVITTPITCPDDQLAPGATMVCTATLAAPADGQLHTNTGSVAATPTTENGTPLVDPLTGEPLAPVTDSDPANATGGTGGLSLVKRINGLDANTPPGALVEPGSAMAIEFVVTNTGSTTIEDVVVADDTIASNDIDCPESALGAGESMTCTATYPAPAAGVAHRNVASVTGQPVGIDGSALGEPVSADDPAHALAVKAGVTVVKRVNGEDANSAPGVSVMPGTTLEFTFEVTNTGSTVLSPVTVTDSVIDAADIACPADSLDAGSSMICVAQLPAPEAGEVHTNLATVDGVPVGDDGEPLVDPSTGEPIASVSDEDPANATSKSPGISLVKLIEGDDANTAPGVGVESPSMMDVTFVVTNSGDVALDPVQVTDSVIPSGDIACPKVRLVPGEAMTCRAQIAAPAPGALHHNDATATGQPLGPDGQPSGPRITDGDEANAYPLATPSVEVVKFINGRDADEAPGVYVRPGTDLSVTFVVTNTGNTWLSPVTVSDDVIDAGAISCPEDSLASGASMTCSAVVDAPADGELHTNVATVTGSPTTADGTPLVDPTTGDPVVDVEDTNTANATSSKGGVSIVKKINGADANTSPGVLVAAGSALNITFEVANTGTTDLIDVVVTDDVIATADIDCPATTLAAGSSMVCTASLPAPSGDGIHHNVGTVVAQPVDGDGEPAGETLTSTDPAYAMAIDPKVVVVKKINGVDANTSPGVLVPAGSVMEITFDVSNEGNVALSPVVVTDDVIDAEAIDCPRNELAVGATMTCTATLPAPAAGQAHTNTASVTGTAVGPDGNPLIDPETGEPFAPAIDTDPANATSTAPGITVVKKINGDDANTSPGVSVTYPSMLTMTFEVTNTGTTDLASVVVADDVIPSSAIACPHSTLKVGSSMTCSASWPAPEPGVIHHNIASATGQPVDAKGVPFGSSVTDEDEAFAHSDIETGVVVVKRINGSDANEAPGITVQAGSVMNITFEVTNTGNTWLSPVTVADDKLAASAISCPAAKLAAGASMTCTATMVAPESGVLHTNTASVTGSPSTSTGQPLADPTDGSVLPPVVSEDSANATGGEGGLSIAKLINGLDANVAPGALVPPGSAMAVSFVVTNTGSTKITRIKVSDDVIAASDIDCPKTSLEAGETMTCAASLVAPAAGVDHRNVGTVSGQPVDADGKPLGGIIEVDDPAHAHAIRASIDIAKSINGVDADTAPGLLVKPGTLMSIVFDVTNTGDVDLADVVVSDDTIDASSISCPTTFLAAGQSMSCSATLPAPEHGVQHKNVATATGTPVDPFGNPVVDADGETPKRPTDSDTAYAAGDKDASVLNNGLMRGGGLTNSNNSLTINNGLTRGGTTSTSTANGSGVPGALASTGAQISVALVAASLMVLVGFMLIGRRRHRAGSEG